MSETNASGDRWPQAELIGTLCPSTVIKLDETDWSYEEAHSQLREELAGLADSLRADETRKMVVVIEVSL